jgi:chromosome segregation ATPase
LIKKSKEDRLNLEKEKTTLNLKLADSQGQVSKLTEEVARLKKEMETSPIALVRGELQNKTQEISDLKKEIDKINQIKEQYKQYYERVREEFIK